MQQIHQHPGFESQVHNDTYYSAIKSGRPNFQFSSRYVPNMTLGNQMDGMYAEATHFANGQLNTPHIQINQFAPVEQEASYPGLFADCSQPNNT
jgi:hypothetical protein